MYLIHSYDPAGQCFDNRLAVQQISSYPYVEIAFRSFRFTTDNNLTQEQKVSCKLHMDPVSSSSNHQAMAQCSCYSPCECGVLPGFTFDSSLSKCLDIDECTTSNSCLSNTDCINTNGSYECISQEGSGQNICQLQDVQDFGCKTVDHSFVPKTYSHQLILNDLPWFSNCRLNSE